MNVLFVTPVLPVQPRSGGHQVSVQRLLGLATQPPIRLTVLCLHSEPGRDHFPGEGLRVISANASVRPRSGASLLGSYASGLPLSVYRNTSPQLLTAARDLHDSEFDLVYVDHWLVWEPAKLVAAPRRVLHLHNAEPALFSRGAAGLGSFQRRLAQREAMRVAAYLQRIMSEIDELHLLSDDDRIELQRWGVAHRTTRIFLPVAEQRQAGPANWNERERAALFVGSLAWPPNAEGLMWFASEVAPLLAQQTRIDIVGGGAPDEVAERLGHSTTIVFHGFVDDLDPLYAAARCFVAPLRSGSGVKLKIVNALAAGLPVVTTRIGAEGFPAGFGPAMRVCDAPRNFARHVELLVTDEQHWLEARHAALAYAHEHFCGSSWLRWCKSLNVP